MVPEHEYHNDYKIRIRADRQFLKYGKVLEQEYHKHDIICIRSDRLLEVWQGTCTKVSRG
jgi:hypothetical protein